MTSTGNHLGRDTSSTHVVSNLSWDLLQQCFCHLLWRTIYHLSRRYELHDITRSYLSVIRETFFISIKYLRLSYLNSPTSMLEKSSLPTPTIRIDRGASAPWTIIRMVSSISWITPSVMMSRTKYLFFSCWICSAILWMRELWCSYPTALDNTYSKRVGPENRTVDRVWW